MLDKLLTVVTTNAKLVVAGAIGAALVAGGGAVAVTQVASSSDSSASAEQANEHSDAKGDNRSDTATAHIDLPKPPKTEDGDTEGAQGVHGACVSAVAHDKSVQGRAHGKAVSEAAHTCPKGGEDAASVTTEAETGDDAEAKDSTDEDSATEDSATEGGAEVKPAKPARVERGKSGSHR